MELEGTPMTDWWTDTDASILECLHDAGPMSPGDIGRRVGLSPSEATAFLCMLVAQGKVKICLVGEADSAGAPMRDAWDRVGVATPVTADA
jgi:predicted ArsR family transcriptional regulator